MKTRIESYEKELAAARETLERLQKEVGRPLRYKDLYPGNILSKHVGSFTFFKTASLLTMKEHMTVLS